MGFGEFDIPNGCLRINVDNQKKYLYPDIKVYNYIQNSGYGNDQRLESMVDANSGTIPEDLLWIENLEDGFGKKISRYTHLVRLIYDEESKTVSEIVSAESNYARFTRYWHVHGSYRDVDKSATYRKFKFLHENSCLPSSGGNLIFHPIFKPWAECDLLIYDETLPKRYANFFLDRLEKTYTVKNKNYRKIWSVNISEDASDVDNRIKDFTKTVSPYKNLIMNCHS